MELKSWRGILLPNDLQSGTDLRSVPGSLEILTDSVVGPTRAAVWDIEDADQ